MSAGRAAQEAHAAEVDSLLSDLRTALLSDAPWIVEARGKSAWNVLRDMEDSAKAAGRFDGVPDGMALATHAVLYALACRRSDDGGDDGGGG